MHYCSGGLETFTSPTLRTHGSVEQVPHATNASHATMRINMITSVEVMKLASFFSIPIIYDTYMV